MKRIATSVFAILVLVTQAGAAPRAEDIVAASKRASGGAAWDRIDGCAEQGGHGDFAYRTWFSVRRYGIRSENRKGASVRTSGFDGSTAWRMDGAGKLDRQSGGAMFKEAVVTAYLSANGFFFPERFPAAFKFVREAKERGRAFDVVEVSPKGGRPVELWFDKADHLLARVADVHGSPAVSVDALDYRRSGDFMVAFRLVVKGPDGKVLDRGAVASLRCGAVDARLFAPPK